MEYTSKVVIYSFMYQHFLTFRRKTYAAQNLLQSYWDKKQEFLSYSIKLRNKNSYELYEIANMDETLIYIFKYAYIY